MCMYLKYKVTLRETLVYTKYTHVSSINAVILKVRNLGVPLNLDDDPEERYLPLLLDMVSRSTNKKIS